MQFATQSRGKAGHRASANFELARYFLGLGTFGFGGPIALTARMQRDLVEERKWFVQSDYLDGLAFAQLAPGPLAAQLAMYLGHLRGGALGATIAGVSFVLPSFLIVVAIAMAYVGYGGLSWVEAAFYGIGPVVIGIVAVAAWRLAGKVVRKDRLLIAILGVSAIWTVISQRELVGIFLASGALTLVVRHRVATQKLTSACFLSVLMLPAASVGGAWELLLYFAKAGLFVFGSGLAIVPFLYAGVVQEHRWLTDRQFLDAVAVAMITPGPVVITVAFIGFLVSGLKGAVAAAIGIFAPVYFMVIVFAPMFRKHSENQLVRSFVAGVTAAAAGAIAGAVVVLARRSIHDSVGSVVSIATVFSLLKWKLPEPAVILAGALIGILLR